MPRSNNTAGPALASPDVCAGINPAGDWRERFDDAVDLVGVLHLVTLALPHILLGEDEMTALSTLSYMAAKELRAIRRDFDGGTP